MRKRWLPVLLAASLILGLAPLRAAAAEPCETMLAGMSTEDKISQMLMPEFRYYTDGSGRHGLDELTQDVADILQKRGFAGVVFFAENAAETAKAVRLADAMQAAGSAGGHPQLFTAVDQEGGTVTRLGQGTRTPGSMALGAAGDLAATKEIAAIIGQELHAVGFNLDFAPVVDVNNNPSNPIIGLRSFSDDPQTVAAQGVAFMRSLRDSGVISTLKHFPGHGDTGTDSHTGLPSINKSYDELRQAELIPFQACIDAGVEAVMTAHIQYPQIETTTYTSVKTGEEITLPATLSKTIITDILRRDMGFDGVVFTDALNMQAIEAHFDPMDAVRLAIEAGVDVMLMPVDTSTKAGIDALDQYIVDVAALADKGDISMDKVDAAVLRILRLKQAKGLLAPYESGDPEARVSDAVAFVGSEENHDKEWEIAKRAVTLVKNENDVLPLTGSGQKIAVLTAYNNEVLSMTYALELLKDAGRLTQDVAVTSIQNMDYDAIEPHIADADHVIVISELGSAAALVPTDKNYSGKVDRIIDFAHQNGKTVTVLSASLPYDVARYQAADALLIAWSAKGMDQNPRESGYPVKQYGANMPAALYLALSPDESPSGTLPVNIPALDDAYHYSDTVLYPRGFGLTYCGRFDDVPADAWYADAVAWAVRSGVTDGTGENRFSPDAPCTRAQAATFLWRAAGSPEPAESAARFEDVESGAYYEKAVAWAVENGVTNGVSETSFAPDATVTRAQIVVFLHRFDETGRASSAVFDDVAPDAWYADAVSWAAENGITTGVDETHFAPDGNCVRAQIVTFLYRLIAG